MADRVISFKGEFDASSILASLKQIRSEMERGGVDTSLFKGVDKDITKAESMITEMLALINKGFSDTKEITAFGKKISTLDGVLTKIGTGLGQINVPESFKKGTKEILELTSKLEESKKNFEDLKLKAIDFASQLAKSHKLSKDEADLIREAVKNEQDLYDVVKKINTEREKSSRLKLTSTYGKMSDDVKSTVLASFLNDKLDSKLQVLSIGFSGEALSTESLKQYRAALLDIAKGEKTVEQAFKEFVNGLNDADKEVVEQDNFIKAYTEDLRTLAHAGLDLAFKEGQITDKAVRTSLKTDVTLGTRGLAAAGASPIGMSLAPDLAEYNAGLLLTTLLTEELERRTEEFLLSVRTTMSTAASGIEDATNRSHLLNEAGQKNVDTMQEEAAAQEDLNKTFNNLLSIVKLVLSLTSAWRGLKRILTQTYLDVTKLDKAFAQIAMVTSYSVNDMWAQYSNYAEMANKLGQSTESVILSSGLFYQQGLDTAEALTLTEDTMKLATLAGLDFSEATSLMTAALRAFHMEMDLGSHITDVYAELAAHAAADVNGIAYAMSKTASIANSAGMSFENTSAFLTLMIETTQEAPENIGTAMKTIIARFTELKENVAGTADSEFDDLDYNKVDKALKSVGVSLKDATGLFRNLDDVFLELSEKWDTLDRNSLRYIATIAAGSRQQSRFIAMMENYDRTLELIETALDSAGKSSLQFAKYLDTVEYKINQLKNTWEELRISFTNSDFFKGAIDKLNLLLKNIKKISKNKKTFIAFITALALSVKTTLTTIIAYVQSSIKKALAVINATKVTILSDNTQVNSLKLLLEEIHNKMLEINGTPINPLTNTAPNDTSASAPERTEPVEVPVEITWKNKPIDLLASNEQWKRSFYDAGKNFGTIFGNAFTAVSTAYLTSNNPGDILGNTLKASIPFLFTQLGIIGTGVTALYELISTGAVTTSTTVLLATAAATFGISLAITALLALGAAAIKSAEQAKALKDVDVLLDNINDKLEDILGRIGETKDSLNSLTEEKENLNSLTERYEELANKVIKTEEETEEYEEIMEKLKSSYPEIISYYDKENNLLKLSADLIEEKNKRLDNLIKLLQDLLYTELLLLIQLRNEQRQLLGARTIRDKTGYSFDADLLNSTAFDAMTSGSVTNVNIVQSHWEYEDNPRNKGQYIPTSITIEDANDKRTQLDTLAMNDFIHKLDGFEDKDINFVSPEELEDIQNAFGYVFGDTPLTEIKEEWQDTLDEMKEGVTGLSEEIKHNFDELYQLQKERMDALMGDSVDDKIKALNASATAARLDLIDNIRFADIVKEGNITWSGGGNLDNYKTMLSKFEKMAKIDYAELGINSDKLAESAEEIRSAIADGAYGNENDWGDVRNNLSSESLALLEAAGVNSLDSYINWIGGKGVSDKSTAQAVAKLLYSQMMTEVATNLKIELDSDTQQAILELTDTSAMTIDELKEKYAAVKEEMIAVYGEQNTQDILSTMVPDYNEIIQAGDTVVAIMGEEFAKKTPDVAKTVSNFYLTALNAGLEELDATSLTRLYTEILENADIDEKDWAAYFLIDWTSISNPAEYESWKKSQIQKMQEAGYEISEELFDKLASISEYTGYLDITISSTVELDAYVEKLQEIQNTVYELKDTFISVINELVAEGELSLDSYLKLAKSLSEIGEDIDDYTTISDDGTILLNESALVDVYDALTAAMVELLEAQKEKAEAELLSLKNGETSIDQEIIEAEGILDKIEKQRINNEAIEEQNKLLLDSIKLLNAMGADITIPELSEGDDGLAAKITVARQSLETLKNEKGTTTVLARIEELEKTIEQFDKEIENAKNLGKAYRKDALEEYQKIVDDTKDAAEKAALAEIDALEEIQKAQDDVIEKLKKLNEVLHGTDTRKAKNGELYNYTTNLERVKKLADDAKSKLDDLQDWDDPAAAMADYLDNVHQELVISKAQEKVYNLAIVNGLKSLTESMGKSIAELNEKYGGEIAKLYAEAGQEGFDFTDASTIATSLEELYTKVGDRYNIDYNKLNALAIPDEFKDRIEEEIKSWNDNLDEIEKLREQEEKRLKEFLEVLKKALLNVVSLLEEMKNTLREKYEQEIEDVENKYLAMEDADNEYVDALEAAIQKLRDLRERENQWSDLADKERKLSLMLRDTSGGNLVETRQLEKEIQDDRLELLDNSIDDIIEGLREMYELQKESREAEIEYRRALLDEGLLMQEVTAALANIDTAEDLVAWFYENTTDLSSMSAEQLLLEEMGWKDLFDAKLVYMETSLADFESALTVTEGEILATVNKTSETLTSEAERALTEVSNKVDDSIDSATTSLTSALDTLAEKHEAYNTALSESEKATAAWRRAVEELQKKIDELENKQSEPEEDDKEKRAAELTSEYKRAKASGVSSYLSAVNATAQGEGFVWDSSKDSYVYNQTRANEIYKDLAAYKGPSVKSLSITPSKSTKKSIEQYILEDWDDNGKNYEDLLQYVVSGEGNLDYQITIPPDSGYTPEEVAKDIKKYFKNNVPTSNGGSPLFDVNLAVGYDSDAVRIGRNVTLSLGVNAFAKGGLVDFTGPAWVDGTKSRPEAFLSADDTKRIGEAAKLLSNLPLLDNASWEKNEVTNTNVGDTVIDIHINIENVSSDYDVDQAVDRVKQDIVDAANYAGSNVILRKH